MCILKKTVMFYIAEDINIAIKLLSSYNTIWCNKLISFQAKKIESNDSKNKHNKHTLVVYRFNKKIHLNHCFLNKDTATIICLEYIQRTTKEKNLWSIKD